MNDQFPGTLASFLALGLILPAVPGVQAKEEEDPEKNAKIYAGINNLTDREPPIVGTSGGDNGNTYPGLYDALGGYLFMGVGMEF